MGRQRSGVSVMAAISDRNRHGVPSVPRGRFLCRRCTRCRGKETAMTDSIRVGVQLWPGGTPDYRTWREAVIDAEELGVDAIFGYDHFHKGFSVPSAVGLPELLRDQPDV